MIGKIGKLIRHFSLRQNKGLAQIPLIIGLLLMAVAIPVATRLAQQNQNPQNRAAGGDGCGDDEICSTIGCADIGESTGVSCLVNPIGGTAYGTCCRSLYKACSDGHTHGQAWCSDLITLKKCNNGNINTTNCTYGCDSSSGTCKAAPPCGGVNTRCCTSSDYPFNGVPCISGLTCVMGQCKATSSSSSKSSSSSAGVGGGNCSSTNCSACTTETACKGAPCAWRSSTNTCGSFGTDTGCSSLGGSCITGSTCAGGTFQSNLCLSQASYYTKKCCVPGQSSSSSSAGSGTVIKDCSTEGGSCVPSMVCGTSGTIIGGTSCSGGNVCCRFSSGSSSSSGTQLECTVDGDCSGDKVCVNNRCVSPTSSSSSSGVGCTEGQTRCNGIYINVCQGGVWGGDASCPPSKTCIGGECQSSSSVAHPCKYCMSGVCTSCSGQDCVGCSTVGNCSANADCSTGTGCTYLDTRCINDYVEVCDQYGQWSNRTSCASGLHCDSAGKKCVGGEVGCAVGVCQAFCIPILQQSLGTTCLYGGGSLKGVCCSSNGKCSGVQCPLGQTCSTSTGQCVPYSSSSSSSSSSGGGGNHSSVPTTACTCATNPDAKKIADANCDGTTNIYDISIWRSEYTASSQGGNGGSTAGLKLKADFNCDGKVDLADRDIWIQQYKLNANK